MEIRELREGDVLVFAPDGSLAGSEETSALETRLVAVLKAGTLLLVIDCTSVGQLTSAAIRVLLLTSRKLGRTGGRLVLCGMNTKVKKAFSISGFDKDFTVVETRGEALQLVLEPVRPSASKAARAPAPPPPISTEPEAPPDVQAVVPHTHPTPGTEAAIPVESPQIPSTPVAAADEPAPLFAAHEAVAAVAAPPPPVPAHDPRDALAVALFDALGVHVAHPAAPGAGGVAPSDLEALVNQVSAALGVRAS